MTGELKVNFGHLQNVADDCKRSANAIDKRLEDLETQLKFLESDWTGEARESYRQAKDKWNGASERMTTILKDLSRSVEEAKIRYQETENRNRDRFNVG